MNILILLLAFPTVVLASPTAWREIQAVEKCKHELKQYEACVGSLKQDYEEIRKDGHAWKDVNKMTSFLQKMEELECISPTKCDRVIIEQHIFESIKHMLKAIYEESSDCVVSVGRDHPNCSEEDIERIRTNNNLRKNLELLIPHKDKPITPSNHRNFHAAFEENQGDVGLFVNGKDDSESEETATDAPILIHEEETNEIPNQTEEEIFIDKQTEIPDETTSEDERPAVETLTNLHASEAQSSVAPDNETMYEDDFAELFIPEDPIDLLTNSTQEPVGIWVGQEGTSQPEDPKIQDEEEVEEESVTEANSDIVDESEGSGLEIIFGGDENENSTLPNIDVLEESEGSVFETVFEKDVNETVTLPNIDTVEESEGSGFEITSKKSEIVNSTQPIIVIVEESDGSGFGITLENAPQSTIQPEEPEPVDMSSIFIGQPEPEDEEETPTATSEAENAENQHSTLPNIDTVGESEEGGFEVTFEKDVNGTATWPEIDTVEESDGSGFGITLENAPQSTIQPEEPEPVDMSSIFIGQPEPEDEEETPTATSEAENAENQHSTLPNIDTVGESEEGGFEVTFEKDVNGTATWPEIDTVEESEGSGFEITLENAPKSTIQPEESEPVDMSSVFIGQPEPEDEEESPTAKSEAENAEIENSTQPKIDIVEESEESGVEITLENAPKSTNQPEESEPIDMSSIYIGQPEPEDEEETPTATSKSENAEPSPQPENEDNIYLASLNMEENEVAEEEEEESISEKPIEVADKNETSIVPPNMPGGILDGNEETQVSSAPQEVSVTKFDSQVAGEEKMQTVKPIQATAEQSPKPGFSGTIKFEMFNGKNSISFALTPFMTVLALMLLF